jgi:hypothetical protein
MNLRLLPQRDNSVRLSGAEFDAVMCTIGLLDDARSAVRRAVALLETGRPEKARDVLRELQDRLQ